MANLPLVMACDSPSFGPLIDGTVQMDGIELSFVHTPGRAGDRHRRMAEEQAFDVCEYSSGNYLCGVPFGLPFTAVPIFPLRLFRQRDVWVSRASGIESPRELAGKRIGMQMWSNSALLWQRALLQHEYGVDLRSPIWVSKGKDDPRFQIPDWVRLERCPADRSLEDLLAKGEIDAMLIPHDPWWEPDHLPHVRRLIEDFVPVEQDYYRRTRLFPPMHTVVIKNAVLAEHSWVAESVFEGLRASLDTYAERLRAANAVGEVWPGVSWAEQEQVLGPQPWPSGLDANRHTVDTWLGYAYEQGVIARALAPEELFQFQDRVLAGVA